MQDKIEITSNPLFGALTRPAMWAGVTFEYHGFNLMVSVCAFIACNNLLYGLIFLPLHAFAWMVCRYDTHFFSVAFMRFKMPNTPNKSIWGVRAYEPY